MHSFGLALKILVRDTQNLWSDMEDKRGALRTSISTLTGWSQWLHGWWLQWFRGCWWIKAGLLPRDSGPGSLPRGHRWQRPLWRALSPVWGGQHCRLTSWMVGRNTKLVITYCQTRLFDSCEQWKCFFSSRSTGFDLFDFEIFSAVQRIPPRAARGRPLGTYLHITNIVATWWEQHQHQHLQHQCNETKDRDLQDQNADYVWWSSYLFAKRFPNCWQQCGQTSCGAEIRRHPNATTVRGCPVRCHLSIFVRCPVRYIVPISDQRSLFFCDNWSPRLTSHGSRGTPTTTSEFSCPVSCEYWIVLLPVASTLMEYYESDRGGRRGETC